MTTHFERIEEDLGDATFPGESHEAVMHLLEEETGQKHDPELMRLFCEVIEASELRAGG